MNEDLIKELDEKAHNIIINEEDTYVKESCKNIYKALLVVGKYENPQITDIASVLMDTNKTINLLKKFNNINNEKYNGNLSYIFVDTNNEDNLHLLIDILNKSINNKSENNQGVKDVYPKNDKIILNEVIEIFNKLNLGKITSLELSPTRDVINTVEVKNELNKLFYFIIDKYGVVGQIREDSLSGKIIYVPDDDYEMNNIERKTSRGIFKNLFSKDILKKGVNEFAIKQGYKGAKYIGNWKEYKVYEPYMSNTAVSYTGLPLVILVNEKGEIRMSTSNEAMETLDDNVLMESFNENKNLNNNDNKQINKNILSNEDVSGLINNIDDEINELKKQENNSFQSNNPIQLEDETDKIIQENLEEVRQFSILNKSVEELLSAKKKYINDWYELLVNTVDEHWIMNSGTYRVKIDSIINAVLRRTDDAISKRQLEYLPQAIDSIKIQNRVMLIKIVVDMKSLN